MVSLFEGLCMLYRATSHHATSRVSKSNSSRLNRSKEGQLYVLGSREQRGDRSQMSRFDVCWHASPLGAFPHSRLPPHRISRETTTDYNHPRQPTAC